MCSSFNVCNVSVEVEVKKVWIVKALELLQCQHGNVRLGFSSVVDDDLSQEEDGREEKPSKPQTQGEIEMFQSQGFELLNWFHIERNFDDYQASLKFPIYFTEISRISHKCDLLEPHYMIGELLLQ